MGTSELTCAGCGGNCFVLFFEGPDRFQEKPGHFRLWRCQDCSTVVLYPQPSPDEMLEHYPDDYVAYRPGQAPGKLAHWSRAYTARKQIRAILQKTKQPGRVLDIGCGTGEFLWAMKKQGWVPYGLEINSRAAQFSRDQRGLDVILGDSLSAAFAAESLDLITFWDVLEHLPDPRQALREAWRIARPGTLLIVSIPNPDSLEARRFGVYWAGWDLPRHLWLFPRQVLTGLFEEEGWEVQEVRYARGRHFILAQSLRFWLQEQQLPKAVRQILLSAISSWAARALLLPYFVILERLGLGSSMVFYARPKG